MTDLKDRLAELRTLARTPARSTEPQTPRIDAMLHALALMIEGDDKTAALRSLEMLRPILLQYVEAHDQKMANAGLTVLRELEAIKTRLLLEIIAYDGGFTESAEVCRREIDRRCEALEETEAALEELTTRELSRLAPVFRSPIKELEALTGRTFVRRSSAGAKSGCDSSR